MYSGLLSSIIVLVNCRIFAPVNCVLIAINPHPEARSCYGFMSTSCAVKCKEVRSKIDSGTYGADCALMFDKMSIHQGFYWNPTTKSYIGYETLPHEGKESERTATHLFVFLLKGLEKGWEYPVAYYFTNALSCETVCDCLRAL